MGEPATELAEAKDKGRSPLASGMALSIAAAFFFGTLAIFAKFAYREGAEALPLLTLRFAVAALLLYAYLKVRRRGALPGPRNLFRLLALGAAGYGVESMLFFLALERAPAAVVGLVFYSYPIWTTLAVVVLGIERLRLPIVGALACASAGILLIFSLPHGGLAGPLFALAAAVAVTVYFLVAQRLLRDVTPAVAALWTSIGAGAFSVVGSALTGSTLPAGAVLPGAGLGFVTAVAFVLMYEAIERIGSSRFAIAATFEPVTTLLLAAAFLGESITLRVGAGALLVVAALPILGRSGGDEIPAADGL